MQSISDYMNNTNMLVEQRIMTENAASLDSLFAKWQNYNYNLANNSRIYEGFADNYDINLSLNESKAANDLLVYFCESLIESYKEELKAIEINEGFKDWAQKAKEKISDKYHEITDKIKGLTELIKNFKDKAIKSIKELAQRFEDFMITCALSLVQIIEKLKGDTEEEAKGYCQMVAEQSKNIDVEEFKKNSLFENAVAYLNGESMINEDYICELFGFGKKKKEKEAAAEDGEDGASKEQQKHYDKGIESKEKKSGGWKKTLFAALKQMAIYWTLTVIIPLALTAIPGIGPGLGAMFGTIAKLTWGAVGMVKQIQMFIKLVKSDEWKHHMKKSTKIFRILLFIFSLYFAGKALKVAGSDLLAQAGAIKEFGLVKALKLIAPDGIVEKLAGIIDGLSKKCGGNGFSGWENIQKARLSAFNEYQKLVDVTTQEAGSNFSSEEIEAANKKLQALQKTGGKWWRAVKGEIKADPDKLKEYVPEDSAISDGPFSGGGSDQVTRKFANKLQELGYDPEKMQSYVKLASSDGKGGFTRWDLSSVAPEHREILTQYMQDNPQGLIGNLGSGVVSSTTQSLVTVIEPIARVMTHSIPFAGFMPILKNKTGYKLRLGSNATKSNYIYKIEKYEEKTFGEIYKEYSKYNETAIQEQYDILEKSKKLFDESIAAAEKDDDKKAVKALNKAKEKFENSLKDSKCVVFLGTKISKGKKNKATEEQDNNSLSSRMSLRNYIYEADEENNESESGIVPVMFINPLLLAAADLADAKSGGKKRKKSYHIKGILSNIEILTEEGGLSQKEVLLMFVKILQEGIKANLNMVADVPCYKDGKKYVVNDKSKYAGKKRPDFGNFTNEEITEIINDKSKAGEYLGGEHYTQKNDTIEKEKKEENVEKFKKYMKEEDEVKQFMEKHPKLKKYFYDESGEIDDDRFDAAYDIIARSEKAYLSGKTQKKGFFKRLKEFFTGKSSDDENVKKLKKIDQDELSELSLLLSKIRQKKSKKKKKEEEETSESLIHPLFPGYYDITEIDESTIADTFFEANMQMMIDEFNDWLIDESMLDDIEPLID